MTEVVLQQAPISAVDEKEAGHIHEKDDSLRDSHSHDGKDPVRNASVVKEITEEEEARYQWGVLKARAITSIWDNKSKWSLFVMWVCFDSYSYNVLTTSTPGCGSCR